MDLRFGGVLKRFLKKVNARGVLVRVRGSQSQVAFVKTIPDVSCGILASRHCVGRPH